MAMPIVTIHRGYAPYLVTTLAQAKFTNPKSEIVLLGDSSNQFLDFVHYEHILNYYSEAQQFAAVYADKHRSPNNFEYELFCFQRWFVLKEFMRARQIEQCVHIDSDLMLYADLTAEWRKFDRFELTLVAKSCGHSAFIKYEGLVKFCQFLTDTYTTPLMFDDLEREQAQRDAKHPALALMEGISDMSLFRRFTRLNPDLVGLASEIIEDSVYDLRINTPMGFEVYQGIKKIEWIDHQPFCRHLELDRLIKFNSLHFQGGTKKYIHRYFTGHQSQVFQYQLIGLWKSPQFLVKISERKLNALSRKIFYRKLKKTV
jgi:hypothetical protein